MPVLYGSRPAEPFLAILEAEIGFGVPLEYANFLRKWNGLFIDGGDYLDFNFPSVGSRIISFSSLFGLDVANKNFDVIDQNQRVKGEAGIQGEFFVIGDDPGGNYYVLAKIDDVHKVLYWDRTHLHAGNTSRPDIAEVDEGGNLYYVADGFSAFLIMIVDGTKHMQFISLDMWPG
ncbi:MAG: SMI1/KNR4 family protein [Burkholderia sp.]|uniref:SMI1/KNR4 family protein n=1 Tax=Burkholderia sp. TaxID=36773 RepID=UPI00283A6560|nr:SMI1/KNR4 family protein [Burkholderia sp.]MDR0244627.1 SMI1/KNR4 family protein [Burkholderia sp.]